MRCHRSASRIDNSYRSSNAGVLISTRKGCGSALLTTYDSYFVRRKSDLYLASAAFDWWPSVLGCSPGPVRQRYERPGGPSPWFPICGPAAIHNHIPQVGAHLHDYGCKCTLGVRAWLYPTHPYPGLSQGFSTCSSHVVGDYREAPLSGYYIVPIRSPNFGCDSSARSAACRVYPSIWWPTIKGLWPLCCIWCSSLDLLLCSNRHESAITSHCLTFITRASPPNFLRPWKEE